MSTYQSPVSDARALDAFIYMPPNADMIRYLSEKARQVIRIERTKPQHRLPPSPPTTPPQEEIPQMPIPPLEDFIVTLCNKSNVQTPTLMTTLVYLARLKQKLPPVAKGLRCTAHRIFLAALILSAKNLNDSSPKNKHWAEYTTVSGYPGFHFSRTEVNLMEKQLLHLLKWELNISEEDLYFHFEPFLTPIKREIAKRDYHEKRKEEKKRAEEEKEQKKQRAAEAIEESQRRNYAENSRYNIPESELSLDDRYMDPTGAIHGVFMDISTPPSSSEVPALSRSGTIRSSTAPSSVSRSQSPDSVDSCPLDLMDINAGYNYQLGRISSHHPVKSLPKHDTDDFFDVKIVNPSPSTKATYPGHLYGEIPIETLPEFSVKPTKKSKASNFMTRLMGRQAI